MRTAPADRSTPSPEPATWGVEPVPPSLRRLGFIDNAVLWGNLGISLLLPIVAAFLVPGLTFLRALGAIAVGVVIGNLMLGYAARIGASTGAPAMVLYRASLGRAGSFAPTALNVLQNVGWGSFELLIIGTASAAISERVFGAALRPVWTLLFGAVVTLMAWGGPLVVVRRWLRRYAVWLVIASTAYLTIYVLTQVSLGALAQRPGEGGTFWGGVDLVVAMPVSWIPLVADYARFARRPGSAMAGTAVGYGVAQAWFYLLGVLLILSGIATTPEDPTAFVAAVLAVPAGLLALGILAVDETDEAFANIYSTAVSIQNVFPRANQRALIVGIGAVCTVIATLVPLVQYENFLLLIGAVFVPLFGVQAADHLVVRRGYTADDVYAVRARVRPWGFVAWILGFLVYNWANPGTVGWWVAAMDRLLHDILGLGTLDGSWVSATLLSFAAAFAIQALAGLPRSTLRAGRGSAAAAPSAGPR